MPMTKKEKIAYFVIVVALLAAVAVEGRHWHKVHRDKQFVVGDYKPIDPAAPPSCAFSIVGPESELPIKFKDVDVEGYECILRMNYSLKARVVIKEIDILPYGMTEFPKDDVTWPKDFPMIDKDDHHQHPLTKEELDRMTEYRQRLLSYEK